MNKYIFTDTSALIAVLNKKDQYHEQAAAAYHDILNGSSFLLITTHVFAETLTRIARRVSQQAAIAAGTGIRNQARITMVTPTIDRRIISTDYLGIYPLFRDNADRIFYLL